MNLLPADRPPVAPAAARRRRAAGNAFCRLAVIGAALFGLGAPAGRDGADRVADRHGHRCAGRRGAGSDGHRATGTRATGHGHDRCGRHVHAGTRARGTYTVTFTLSGFETAAAGRRAGGRRGNEHPRRDAAAGGDNRAGRRGRAHPVAGSRRRPRPPGGGDNRRRRRRSRRARRGLDGRRAERASRGGDPRGNDHEPLPADAPLSGLHRLAAASGCRRASPCTRTACASTNRSATPCSSI